MTSHVLDLDSLELLLAIAVTGSFGRAAARHGISQPAVSARVRTMEALVGVPLVERSPRGSSLTAAGVLVAGWARDVVGAAEILDAGIASLRSSRERQLEVAASMTIAEHLLPRWLVRLAADRPQTAVSLKAMNSSEVQDATLHGSADLGFIEGPEVQPGLQSQIVGRDRLVVVVAPSHPWARGRRIDAAELAATRWVHREPASGTRIALEVALADHPRSAPLLELSTTTAVRAAAIAGAGPAALSRLAVADDVERGRLVAVATTGVELTRVLRAVWPTGHRLSHPAQDLLRIAATRSDRPRP